MFGSFVPDDLSYGNITRYVLRDYFRGMSDDQIATFRNEFAKARRGELGHYVGDGRIGHDGQQGLVLRKDVTGNVGMTTGLGLAGVPLIAPAQLLVPAPTPLRNRIPRRVVGGRSCTWRQLISPASKVWGSVAEASSSTSGRNTPITLNEKDQSINFKSIEQESLLTPEADFGSRSAITPGQDFQAAEINDLMLMMYTFLAEEDLDLGGNITALGSVANTALHATQQATTVGSLSTATAYYVWVTALTLQGVRAASKGQGSVTASVDALGETTASVATLTTAAPGQPGDESIVATWDAKRGAAGYNVFISATNNIAAARWHSTVYVNKATINAIPGSGNRPNAADQTANALDYDGLITLCSATTAGYFLSLDGATLTSDGTTNVAQYDTAFKYFFDEFKTGPDLILEGSTVAQKANQIMAAGYTINLNAGDQGVVGGMAVGPVRNYYMPSKPLVRREVHPSLPAGMALFFTETLGPNYPNANIGANVQKLLGWDYRKAPIYGGKRAAETLVDLNGALAIYAKFAMGAIVNIG